MSIIEEEEESILVREEWYSFYLKCEANLEKIRKILENEDFKKFYNGSEKEKSDHFDNFIIDIYGLCTESNPETREHIEARVRLRREEE